MKQAALLMSFPAGILPEWIHLLPSGTFSAVDGRGPWRNDNPAGIIAASMAQRRLLIDVNHSTDYAAPRGEPAPAIGWVTEMVSKANGIWGHVVWNKMGTELLADAAYRFISPVMRFLPDKDTPEGGSVTIILRASLTNNPALPQLTALNSAKPSGGIPPIPAQMGVGYPASLVAMAPAGSHLTDDDRRIARAMNIDPSALQFQKELSRSSGLSIADMTLCRERRIDPTTLGASNGQAGLVNWSKALSGNDLHIAELMGRDPWDLAARKLLRSLGIAATGPETFGLSPAEQLVCRKLGIDLKSYADNKRQGPASDLIVAKLDPQTRSMLERGYFGPVSPEELQERAIEYWCKKFLGSIS